MKVIAAMFADLEVTPLGTRSRLAEELAGVPVLRRTVERLLRIKQLDGIHVLCPLLQHERCVRLLHETGAVVHPCQADPPPWGRLVQAARKWSLDGWRGGVGGTTSFDEYTDCRVWAECLRGAGDLSQVDALLIVPPAAPLLDPALADRMIDHRRTATEGVRLVFTQSPPGVAGILLDADLVHELAEKRIPVGWLFAYQPDHPRKDLVFLDGCLDVPVELRHAGGRLVADTQRAMGALAELLAAHEYLDLAGLGQWLNRRERETIEPLPRELEIELTTDDPYPSALLRPRGARIPARGPIDVATVRRAVDEIMRFDDALVVLGGFGDPLRHSGFAEVLGAIRAAGPGGTGPFGLAVRTTGVDLSDDVTEALISHGVDVLMVTLDAWTPDGYGCLQSPADPAAASLEHVRRRMERVGELCRDHGSARPIVLPEMTKARENVHELEAFHDGWLRRLGAVCISGVGHYAHQVEDRSVICMAPADREPCRRLRNRCLLLADGRVTLCDQDFRGQHALGSLADHGLEELWTGEGFTRIRADHRAGRVGGLPLCARCDEWHRP